MEPINGIHKWQPLMVSINGVHYIMTTLMSTLMSTLMTKFMDVNINDNINVNINANIIDDINGKQH
jgi:hypothetical protein